MAAESGPAESGAAEASGDEQGGSFAVGLDPPAAQATADVGDLVLSYLEGLQEGLQQNSFEDEPLTSEPPTLGTAELAYGLDQTVSSYLEQQGLPLDHYHDIQQDLLNALADVMEERGITEHGSFAVDEFGNADGAEVLGVLDGHLLHLLEDLPELHHGIGFDDPASAHGFGFTFDS